jgi:transposase InsO family protein
MDDPRVEAAAIALTRAPHGQKSAIARALAADMRCSVQTAYAWMGEVLGVPLRQRRRRDAGQSALQRHEAELIWKLIEETRRQTGTGALPLMEAVRILRANGEIQAGRIDPDTGEFLPLSESAIRRGLQLHGLGSADMGAESPACRLSSPHPNWCWQVDASVSRQFYLADSGTEVMDQRTYYRNKPQNFVKINERRIWRYAITDHCSGCIEVFYVQGAESSANAVAALIHAMTKRPLGTMHGVPKIVMSDPGSGFTAAPTKNLLAALGIRFIQNQQGNSRAKGQVENGNYIIETHFEAALKLRAPVTSIAEINGLAQEWARAYNATAMHSRTGLTRLAGFLRITPDQLVLAPPVATLQALTNSNPKQCTVRDTLIRFGGKVYDVRGLPGGAVNGRKLSVVRNALDTENVRVLLEDEDRQITHYLAPLIDRNDWGFLGTAAEIGSEFRAVPEGPAEARKKALERLAMDASTDAEAAERRRAKRPAFAGRVDPMKHIRETEIIPHLPRAATPSTVVAPTVVAAESAVPAIRPAFVAPVYAGVELAMALRRRVEARGGSWTPQLFAVATERWPEGVTEEQLDAAAVALMSPTLRVAGGAA